MWHRMKTVLVMSALIACSGIVWACNVPVFRYALDHWRPDAYRAAIVCRAPLTEKTRATIETLQQSIEDQRLNLTLQIVDANSTDSSDHSSAANAPTDSNAVQLLVRYPSDLDIGQPLVSVPLDSVMLDELTESPLRRQLVKRLVEGQSAVWLLVESGDEAADTLARQTLISELHGLQSTLELPKLTDDPEDAIKGGPALRVEFSLLELKKGDAREWALRSMLLGSEPDLRELNEPMVFPVFGCGRALWPLVGAGINAQNIRESATFLSGACSCQVKEQNPGFDLLLPAKWSELLPWTESSTSAAANQATQVAQTIAIPKGSQAFDPPSPPARDANTTLPVPASASIPATAINPVAIVSVLLATTVLAILVIRRSRAVR